MKKKFIIFAMLFCLSLSLVSTCFSFTQKSLSAQPQIASVTPETSVFIKNPTFATIYNNNVYFVDEETSSHKFLKIYNLTHQTFESNMLDISKYQKIIDVMPLNENLFILAKTNTTYYILQINLTNLTFKELTHEKINASHSKLFVNTLTFDSIDYYFISLTPNEITEQNYPIIILTDNNLTVKSAVSIKLDSNDKVVKKVVDSLFKMFTIQSNDEDEVCLIYFAGANVYYSDILFSKFTSQSEIVVSSASSISGDLSNIDEGFKLNAVNLIEINKIPHFAVTYTELNTIISITNFYTFNIGDSSDTKITNLHHTDSTTNSNVLTNQGYMVYPNQQEIVCKEISYDAKTKQYSTVKQDIKNPNIVVNYFTDENFIYKTTKKATGLLSNPWSAESIVEVPENADIIAIGSAQIQRARALINDYIYCLYTVNNINYTGYVLTANLEDKEEILLDNYDFKEIVTVYDGTTLYSLPTKVINNNISANLNSTALYSIPKETKVKIIDTICKYTSNNCTFVKVEVNNIVGYIDCNSIIEQPNEIVYLKTNSAISKDGTKVYAEANVKSEVKDVLDENKMVRIDGARDTKNGFTHITYNDEYGNVLSGYIVTDYIESDSWSTMQIVGCVLIAINIGLLILILIFKKEYIGKDGQKYQRSKKANYKES